MNKKQLKKTWLWILGIASFIIIPLSPYVFAASNGVLTQSSSNGNGGTVTAVSVVNANGLAGTVANSTTNPAITLVTTGGVANALTFYNTASGIAPSGLFASTTNLSQINFLNNSTTGNLIGIPDNGADVQSIAVGSGALIAETTTQGAGNGNYAFGTNALGAVTSQGGNIGIGYDACADLVNSGGVNPSSNICIGRQSGIGQSGHTSGLQTGNDNTILGGNSDVANNATRAVIAGFGSAAGNESVVLGSFTNNNPAAGTDQQAPISVIAGYDAATKVSGTNNVIMGPFVAGSTLTTGTHNILIGTNNAIDATTSTESNSIHFGGTGGDWVHVTGTDTNSTEVTTINGAVSITTPLGIASGGTNDSGTAWTQSTPVPTCGTGTPTTISSVVRYKTIGKTAFISVNVTDTTNGTCSGTINVGSLPVTANENSQLACRETQNTGTAGTGFIASGGTSVSIGSYNNGTLAGSGNLISCTGVFETQ